MADCEWAVLCDYAFKDVGRKTCMIGVFDRIFATGVPAQHHQAAFVFRLIGDASEKVKFRVEITRPTGGVIGSIGGEVQLPPVGTAEFITNLQGLPLPDWGVYNFALYLGDALTKSITLVVIEQKKPSVKPTSGDGPSEG